MRKERWSKNRFDRLFEVGSKHFCNSIAEILCIPVYACITMVKFLLHNDEDNFPHSFSIKSDLVNGFGPGYWTSFAQEPSLQGGVKTAPNDVY